jgi:hypothetical protein
VARVELTFVDDIEDVHFAEMPVARASHARLEAQEKRAARSSGKKRRA